MDHQSLLSEEEFEKRKAEFSPERGEVCFYCKDCKQLVETERINPNRYIYECKLCKGKNIALGTEASLTEYYHIT